MPVAPSGTLSIAIDALRTLISNVVYFQTWTGAASQAAALKQIFTGEMGSAIQSVTIAGGVITVVTRDQHPFAPAQVIEIEGASLGAESAVDIDGAQTIVATPTPNSFTLNTALPNQGPWYPDGSVVLPAARPLVCISEEDDSLNYQEIADATSLVNGALEVLIDANISQANQQNSYNALYEMKNAFAQLCDGMMAIAGTDIGGVPMMYLRGVTVVAAPKFIDGAEHADNTVRYERWQALIRVTWGLE